MQVIKDNVAILAKTTCCLLLLVGVNIIAWRIQAAILLNWDVAWLMEVARRLLAGGHYVNDFFEINPPMILYLYSPPVWFAGAFGVSVITALRIYLILLSICSLLLSLPLLFSYFGRQNINFIYTFIIVLDIIYLIIPMYEFGQREHLLLMLIMPYLFLVANRMQHPKFAIRMPYALLIGLLAGVGFSLKPFYVLPLICIEGCYAIHARKLTSWLRPEILAMAIVASCYLVTTFLFHPTFINVIIPYVHHFYYAGYARPYLLLFSYDPYIFCLITIIYYLMVPTFRYRTLSNVYFCAMVGFILAYLVARSTWYYHILPAYSLSILLCILLYNCVLTQMQTRLILKVSLAMLIIAFPLYFTYSTYHVSRVLAKAQHPLITFLQENAKQKSVYFFSTVADSAYPFVSYANVSYASRVAALGFIPAIINQERTNKNNPSLQAERDKMMQLVIDDIHNHHPNFIFVDDRQQKPYLNNISFDHIQYFSANKQFQAEWAPYHYYKTIDLSGYRRYRIYVR